MQSEANALTPRRELLAVEASQHVELEEGARQMIHAQLLHAARVKMLRRPGEVAAFSKE